MKEGRRVRGGFKFEIVTKKIIRVEEWLESELRREREEVRQKRYAV